MAIRTGTTGDDTLAGTNGADTITGDAGNDSLLGRDGDDFIDGGSGDDAIYGGAGNDWIIDGPGLDTLNGGDGIDTFERDWGSLPGDTFVMDLNLILGLQAALGGDPNDADHFSGIENYTTFGFIGGLFTGNDVANVFRTDKGVDTILGNGGDDHLYAGAARDVLRGGAGDDLLHGGTGRDTLSGGAGDDQFHFDSFGDGGDRITDFGAGQDAVYLASAGFGNLALGQLDEARFVSGAGVVALDRGDRVLFDTTDATLWFDMNGNRAGGRTLIADLQDGASLGFAEIVFT